MAERIKEATAFSVIVGPVLDADGAAVTTAGISDFKISKNGAAPAAFNGSATATHRHTGHYSITGTTSDSDTVGLLTITLDKTTDAMSAVRLQVVPTAVYTDFDASGADIMDETDVQAAVAAELATYDPPTHAEIQPAVDAALVAYDLHRLVASAVDTDWATTVLHDSVLGLMASKDSSNTFSRTTDSLEGQADTQAAALLDLTDGVESGVTVRQALRGMSSILVGIISGAGTGTEVFKGIAQASGGTTRVTVTADNDGNRSAVTLNL